MSRTASRTDWTSPHWEAVAAEQIAIDRTIIKVAGVVRVARAPHGGRPRLRDPETGGLLRSTGDVAAFGPYQVLSLFFANEWHVIPSHDELMRWTFDGIAETPDGRTVEPDARDSWLVLLNLV